MSLGEEEIERKFGVFCCGPWTVVDSKSFLDSDYTFCSFPGALVMIVSNVVECGSKFETISKNVGYTSWLR